MSKKNNKHYNQKNDSNKQNTTQDIEIESSELDDMDIEGFDTPDSPTEEPNIEDEEHSDKEDNIVGFDEADTSLNEHEISGFDTADIMDEASDTESEESDNELLNFDEDEEKQNEEQLSEEKNETSGQESSELVDEADSKENSEDELDFDENEEASEDEVKQEEQVEADSQEEEELVEINIEKKPIVVEQVEDNSDEVDDEIEPEDNTINIEQIEEEYETTTEDGITIQKAKTKNIELYILIDKENPNLQGYFESFGVPVSNVYYNVKEAGDRLMSIIEPKRIAIIETGTGIFSLLNNRKTIMEIISLQDDDDRITLFSSDDIIETSINEDDTLSNSKFILKHKFISTMDVLIKLIHDAKSQHEHYVKSRKAKKSNINVEEFMKFKGANLEGCKLSKEPPLILSAKSIEEGNNSEEYQQYDGYKIII